MMRSLVVAALISGCGGIKFPDVAVDVDVGPKDEPAVVAEPDAGTQQIAPVTEIACASLGTRAFTQGDLKATINPTDFAIQGAGYFVLERGGAFTYSRLGHFEVNDDGRLVTTDGRTLQTFENNALTPLTIGSAISTPLPTSNITIRANLDATSSVKTFDPTSPEATSALQTTVTLYDQLGTAHSLDIYWTHTAAGTWEFHAMTDGGGLDGGTAGTQTEIASGTLNFDTDGKLNSSTSTTNFTPMGAVVPQALIFNFGDDTASGGTGLFGVTQFGSFSRTGFTMQDGHPSGALNSLAVYENGRVLGFFSNGLGSELATIPLALFAAPQALLELPGGVLLETNGSGSARIDQPLINGRGRMLQSLLEIIPATACRQ